MILRISTRVYDNLGWSLAIAYMHHTFRALIHFFVFLDVDVDAVVGWCCFFSSLVAISSELIFRTKTRSCRLRASSRSLLTVMPVTKEHETWTIAYSHIAFPFDCMKQTEKDRITEKKTPISSIDHGQFFDFDEMETSDYAHEFEFVVSTRFSSIDF